MIYFEASASTKVAKTLADETGVELAVLNPLESLTQKEQEAGENYVSVMKENLAALQKHSLIWQQKGANLCIILKSKI